MNKQNNNCMKNEYLNEDGSVNIEKMNQLSESKIWGVFATFNEEQQKQYLQSQEWLTLDEFEAKAFKMIDELWGDDETES